MNSRILARYKPFIIIIIMRYSISNYSVMCVYCVFGKQEKVSQQEGSFVSTEGVSDWSNIGRLVKLHIYESPPT